MDKYLGKRLDGRYEMRELIGIGGMAYVYKAYDAVDDRVVAVKILKDEYLNNQEFVRRFRNESKAIAILNHENIVKVLDVGFGERLQYIVMEHIDGITLKEYLDQRKEIRWKEAVHFAIQILKALQHAHDKGIVHRDIKPQNVMLLSDGTIKVTDFGIARLTRSEMQVTAVGNKAIGSVHYISPEQARGEITDEKADLYSVGIVLYEMLTGKLPFEADNAVSVAIMQMQTEAKAPHLINEEIPGGLEQITLKAMQKDTSRRYQSAAEMLSDFDEFKRNPSIQFEYTYFEDETPTRYVDAISRVRGEEPEQKSEKRPAKKSRRVSPTDIIIPAVAAIIVVLFVVLAFFVFPGDDENDVKAVKVPNFIGMTREEIEEKMEEYPFEIVYNDPQYRDDIPAGQIYNQKPASNMTIKEGGEVTLFVSAGVTPVNIPDVVPGTSLKAATKMLEDAGFVVVTQDAPYNDKYKLGTVVEIYPVVNTPYPKGGEVTVFVNSEENMKKELPSVVFLSKADAIKKLEKAGFSTDDKHLKIVEVNNPDNDKGVVFKMSPASGKKYAPDVKITLTVASGYQDVTIQLDLPQNNDAIDLQFFMDGSALDEWNDKFLNKLPMDLTAAGKNTITVSEQKASYTIVVKMRPAGSGAYVNYLTITVNGEKGTYETVKHITDVTPPTTPPTDADTTPSAPAIESAGEDA